MKLRVLSPAVDEIAVAALWYDEQRQALGIEFWDAVDQTLASIEANPLRFERSEFATNDIDLRFAYLRQFKYVVHFVLERDEVQVVAVSHTARKPGYWLQRIRVG